MKRALIRIFFVVVALALIAAVPVGENIDQRLGKICIDPSTGQEIPCPKQPYQPGKIQAQDSRTGRANHGKNHLLPVHDRLPGTQGVVLLELVPG